MMKKLILLVALGCMFFMFASTFTLAVFPSNQSIAAQNNISQAEDCIIEMLDQNLSIYRANESLKEAKQIYDAQAALERLRGNANYALVFRYSNETCSIMDAAFKAHDELEVFLDEYQRVGMEINLSAMDGTYQSIMKSYIEERFEETPTLISEGYDALSATQAQQTTLNLFYDSTKRNIVAFFVNNWKIISTIFIIVFIVLIVTWREIRIFIVKKKIESLRKRKSSVMLLIKRSQNEYFKTKKMSELEFNVKLDTFKNIIRDIDRQFPIYYEELAKLRLKKGGKSK